MISIRGGWQRLIGVGCLAWARWRRRRGLYDNRTLGLYWLAWRRSGARVRYLLALARFRRDLGRPLPRRWQPAIEAGLPSLTAADRALALSLLRELQGPDAEMAARRLDFAAWLAGQRHAGGVCVVGNAAGLAGARLGAQIDAHAAVIRFNQWCGPQTSVTDLGSRCAVWVLAPGFSDRPQAVPAWAVFSGADPVSRLPVWAMATELGAAGAQVLTVPLPVWKALVARLQAPPSAALLLLAWLHALGGWEGLRIAAIAWGGDPAGRHHLVQPNRKTGSRHRWEREAQIVKEWRNAGLHDLGQSVPGLAQRLIG